MIRNVQARADFWRVWQWSLYDGNRTAAILFVQGRQPGTGGWLCALSSRPLSKNEVDMFFKFWQQRSFSDCCG